MRRGIAFGGNLDALRAPMLRCRQSFSGGAVAQLGARLDGIEEVVGSNPIGSTNWSFACIPISLNSPSVASLLAGVQSC
jgi:hypothetical protein